MFEMYSDHSFSHAYLQGGQNQLCWQRFKTRFNDVVRDVIKFAKKVPGFTALDLDDQVSLIKGGCFEVSVQCNNPEYQRQQLFQFLSPNHFLAIALLIHSNIYLQ